jgi:alkylation response protein AidB-like acyl-CoA dehydrogenase
VLALPVPQRYGGLGHDPLTCCYALEGLGRTYRDLGVMISAGAHVWAVELPLMKFGTREQRDRLLPALASGASIGAHAITETDAGSDSMAMQATATRSGRHYVLTGRKRFVTNAPLADVILVYATIGARLGFTGVTAFVLDKDQPGLKIEPEDWKAGLQTSPWGQVVLEECVVAEDQRLGAEKQGSQIFATVMAWERALILAPLLGTMAWQVEQCVSYANERRQFGRRIAAFESVAHRIVDMQVRLEASRSASYRAAWELSAASQSAYSEVAKLQVSEAAVGVFSDAMQVFGAYGYTVAAGLERRLRDSLGTRISSGTSDMQRVVLAARLGLR